MSAPEDKGNSKSCPDLSVVVPVYNAAQHLEKLAEDFLSLREHNISCQCIFVDDGSSDGSREVISDLARSSENIVSAFNGQNRGAGIARNVGWRMATGRYTLFFDADDTIHRDVVPQVLARMDMHPTLDTAILFYSRQKRETSEVLGMARIDQDLLLECLGGRDEAMGPPNAMAGLLAMNNFPWNKILRTERFRQAGLKFGKTQVHNDLLGHWHALLHARQVLLMNKTLCTHRVSKSGSNLTSRFNADRLQMFAALSELLDFLEDRPEWSRMYARQFWGLAQRMVDWAGPRLDPDLKTRFDMQYSDLLCRIHLADLARMRTQGSGGLAKRIVNHLIR